MPSKADALRRLVSVAVTSLLVLIVLLAPFAWILRDGLGPDATESFGLRALQRAFMTFYWGPIAIMLVAAKVAVVSWAKATDRSAKCPGMSSSSGVSRLAIPLLAAAVLCFLAGYGYWLVRQRGATEPRGTAEARSPSGLTFVVCDDKEYLEFPAGESATAMKSWLDGILPRPAGPAAPGRLAPWFPEYKLWKHEGGVKAMPSECYVIVANGPDLYLGANYTPRVRIRSAEVAQFKKLLKSHGKPLKGYEERIVQKSTAAGMANDQRFLNLADDQEERIENRESALNGVITVTKVQPVTYDQYLEEKRARRVTAETLRDGFMYFAVTHDRCCPFPNGVHAWVTVTERYKAPCPK